MNIKSRIFSNPKTTCAGLLTLAVSLASLAGGNLSPEQAQALSGLVGGLATLLGALAKD